MSKLQTLALGSVISSILFFSFTLQANSSVPAHETEFQVIKESVYHVNRGSTANGAKGLIKKYIKKYPDSEYKDDAYLLMSSYLLNRNDPKDGAKWLSKLIKEFPKSDNIAVAQQYLNQLAIVKSELKKSRASWRKKEKAYKRIGRELFNDFNNPALVATKNTEVGAKAPKVAPKSTNPQSKSNVLTQKPAQDRGYPESESFKSLESAMGLRQYFSDQADYQAMSKDEIENLIRQLIYDIEALSKLAQRSIEYHKAAIGSGYSYQRLPSSAEQYVKNNLYVGLHKLLYRYARLLSTIEHSKHTVNYAAGIKQVSAVDVNNTPLLILHKGIYQFLTNNNWRKILHRCQFKPSYSDALCIDPHGNFDNGHISASEFRDIFVNNYLTRLDIKAVAYIESGKFDQNDKAVIKKLAEKSIELMPKTNIYLNPVLIDQYTQKEIAWSNGALKPDLIRQAYSGDADAMFEVSKIYVSVARKNSQSKAMEQAIIWQRRAAEVGQTDAQHKIAMGQHKDSLRRVKGLAQAAANGHQDSILELSAIYLDRDHRAYNQQKGIDLLKQAAMSGHARSAYKLGSFYSEEKGDTNVAISYFDRSVSLGYDKAKVKLAKLYMERGRSGDHQRAAKLCLAVISSNQSSLHDMSYDVVEAHTLLGYMYEHGLGIKQSYGEAYDTHLSVVQKSPESAMAVARFAMRGKPYVREKSYDVAKFAINLAYKSGSSPRFDILESVACSINANSISICKEIHPVLRQFTDKLQLAGDCVRKGLNCDKSDSEMIEFYKKNGE